MLKKIKTKLRNIKKKLIVLKNIKQIKSSDCILIDTPTHGNLGDHAIAEAEKDFIKKNLKNSSVFEIIADDYDVAYVLYNKMIKKEKIILVHGGGFLGYLWPIEEFRFRKILNDFQNNKIIVFPQTVTFDMGSEDGKKFFEKSYEIYKTHKNLTIYVRERKSYEFMKKYMPEVIVKLVPDIVTQMKIDVKKQKRENVLLLMRKDCEKVLTANDSDMIVKILGKLEMGRVINSDTVVNHSIQPKERMNYLNKKFIECSQSKLIVTDRLHGMIFAAITNTPCIAFGNLNGKVQGVYEWIKENEYIRFVNNMEEFENILENLNLEKKYHYKPIDHEFNELRKEIASCVEK